MFIDDRLDERKKRILRAIIDDYINTAEPIGSRTIARKHELGLSSATIRNEMSDLEELGFLEQPHTSAGRIPSDKGYRFYVDQLMKVEDLPLEEIENIKRALDIKINELNQLIKQASAIMSRITKYTSMAITPSVKKSALKSIQVVPVERGKALVVIVTNSGLIKHNIVKVPENLNPEFFIKISNVLHEKLTGIAIEQINLGVIREIEEEIGLSKGIVISILSDIADSLHNLDNSEVFLDGATNILNFPEFRDVIKARDFLNVLDEKDTLCKLLSNQNDTREIIIKIGNENPMDEIKECTLITATYNLGGITIGSIGVIGPTRMEYPRVISSMNYMRRRIDEEIKKLIGEEPNSSG